MNHYSFLLEDQQVPMNDPAIDPNAMLQQGGDPSADFQPLIKGPEDIPHSREKAEVMKIAAQIREIEAKTKETLNKANNPDMAAGGIDPMTGMPMDPSQQKSFTAVGRAYKLKKIYDILDKLSNLLHTTPDTKLQEISKEVDEGFELFRLVVNNLKLYKDQVDDLIVMYYAMLKNVCDNIENVYKERKLESSITESKLIRKNLVILGEGIEE